MRWIEVTRRIGLAAIGAAILLAAPVEAQQSVGSGGLRPFVIGTIPVFGRGRAVGGVSIDAQGVLDRATVEQSKRLQEAWSTALGSNPARMQGVSRLRKISLRRLERALADCRDRDASIPWEMQFLAGLERLEYVFLYPQQGDVVLAGYAEGWIVTPDGHVVGETSGQPVLRLEDLIVALRSAEEAGRGQGITCSIDPTQDGLARYQRLTASRQLEMSGESLSLLEESLGPSTITFTGVEPDTRFAQVLVGADFLMKRLAMDFEPMPLPGMDSYLDALARRRSATRDDALLRFWFSPFYTDVQRSPDGLAWHLVGQGVRLETEDSLLHRDGTVTERDGSDPLAREWAERFTGAFPQLAARQPAFAELRNCFDLAVAGAVLARYQLLRKLGLDRSAWLDPAVLDVARYESPRSTPSRASFVRRGREAVVSLSGGVDVDSWGVLETVSVRDDLNRYRIDASPDADAGWWWD